MFIKTKTHIFSSEIIGEIRLFDSTVQYFDKNKNFICAENFNNRISAQERFDKLFKMLDK